VSLFWHGWWAQLPHLSPCFIALCYMTSL
jgi:hypothetical protein